MEQGTWVRIPASTPCTSRVMATLADCKPAIHQFESDLVLQRPARKMANPAALEAVVSQFESEAGHTRESVNGKPFVSKTKTLGSSPSSRAIGSVRPDLLLSRAIFCECLLAWAEILAPIVLSSDRFHRKVICIA